MPLFHKIIKIFISKKMQVLWIVATMLIVYFLFYAVNHATNPSNGFASYYTASRLLIEGEEVANFYNDDYFSSNVERFVPGIYEIYLVNMPTTSVMMLPFAMFDYSTARILWIAISLVLFAGSTLFLLKEMKFTEAWLPFILILIFSFQPLYSNIVSAQAYMFILSLMILMFIGYKSGKEKMQGVVVGISLILKSSGLLLLLLFVIQKKWKSLLWVSATVIFFFVSTLPFLGLSSWFAYGNKLFHYFDSPTLSVTAYQSIHSFFYHFFVLNEKWNPEPIFNLAIIGKLLTIMVSLTILIITSISSFKNKRSDIALGLFIIAGLILNPATIDYHYILILIPVIILLDWLRNNSSFRMWGIFLVSFILIALSIPYTSSKVTSGIWAILAYPKLYGALGLWGLSLRAAYDSKVSEDKFQHNIN